MLLQQLLALVACLSVPVRTEIIPPEKLPIVTFEPQGEIDTASSHWLLHLQIDLEPYEMQLESLEAELKRFGRAIGTQMEQFILEKNGTIPTLRDLALATQDVLLEELNQYLIEVDLLKQLYEDITILFLGKGLPKKGDIETTRDRRSLFSFVGSFLSTAFGIPSERDLSLVKANIKSLHQTTNQLRENIIQNMHIISSTQTEVEANRRMINQLSDTVKKTSAELFTLLTTIESEIANAVHFSTITDRIQTHFSIAASNIRVAYFQMSQLKNDLAHARIGALSPSLVSSKQLVGILKKIRQKLPKDTNLPFKIKEISHYFDLPCILTRNSGSILSVLLDIPLKNTINSFSVYKIIQIPAMVDHRQTTWSIESPNLAISEDRENYMLLSDAEFNICKTTICKLHKATFSADYGSHCEIALYNKDPQAIRENCVMIRQEMSAKISLKWLFENVWLISGARGQVIDIVCGSKLAPSVPVESTTIQSNVQVLSLRSECFIDNPKFQTPPMIKSTQNFTIDLELNTKISNISTGLVDDRDDWEGLTRLISDSGLTRFLEQNDFIPVHNSTMTKEMELAFQNIQDQKDNYEPFQNEETPVYFYIIVAILLGLLITVLIVVSFAKIRQARSKGHHHDNRVQIELQAKADPLTIEPLKMQGSIDNKMYEYVEVNV